MSCSAGFCKASFVPERCSQAGRLPHVWHQGANFSHRSAPKLCILGDLRDLQDNLSLASFVVQKSKDLAERQSSLKLCAAQPCDPDSERFSLQLSEVLQLSSGIALLGTAELAGDSLRDFRSEASVWECAKIADFWLMNCVPERKLEP